MDESFEIKIWDLRNSELLCTLNRKSETNEKHIEIDKIGLADNGKILVAHSKNEFFFWSLGNSVKKLKFEGKDLNQSTLQVDSENIHRFFKPYNVSVVYLIN